MTDERNLGHDRKGHEPGNAIAADLSREGKH
jgi:hypothetical protein